MQYSFSTVFMAFLSSTIVIIFTAICFCNKKLLISFGYKMFALVLGLTALRFLLPFQFSFTANVVLPDILSKIIALFRRPFFMVSSLNVSLWTIFELIWIIGALVKLVLFIKDTLVFNHWVVWYSINVSEDEHYCRLLEEICGDSANSFCVFELSGLKVPMLYGIRNPRILIPIGMELQEDDLRYLLSHETAHHFHHDIAIKLGMSLLTIIYWWNPACYVLKDQLDAVLEMRIDDYVTKGAFETTRGYLRCIARVAEERSDENGKRLKIPGNSIALFNPRHFNTLTNRFELMNGEPKPYDRFLHVTALTMTVAVYLLSYAFIFEAYLPPQEENLFEAPDPYIYAVLTEDNIYEVHYGDLLIERTDSLENYPDSIPVYNSFAEVPAELRVTLY